MKRLILSLMFLSFFLFGCFSESLLTTNKYNTKEELILKLEKDFPKVPIIILDLTGFDSFKGVSLKYSSDGLFYGYEYLIYHGPFSGIVSFSSEFDLGMRGMSLFAGESKIDNEFSYKEMVIRVAETKNIFNTEIAQSYQVSFAFKYKDVYYYGDALYNRTNDEYEQLSIQTIVENVKLAYDQLN